MSPTGRNDPCPCGSGKRYKHCHGSVSTVALPAANDAARGSVGERGFQQASSRHPSRLHLEALRAHRTGLLTRAATLYQQALAESPDDADSQQMLAMVEFERRHYREALEMLVAANARVGWSDPVYRQNLGLVLAKLISPTADVRQAYLVAAYLERARALKSAPVLDARVSVVLISDSDRGRIERSINSVAAQTAGDIELVVAGTANRERDTALAAWHGALSPIVVDATNFAQAANRGAARATGAYVAFLESGDGFAPERVATMWVEVARAEPQWGFSRVRSTRGAVNEARGESDTRLLPGDFRGDEPASFALLHDDIIRARGNLFVHRELFLDLGGFRDVDAPAWELALRASRSVEPVAVAARLYVRDGRDDRGPAGAYSRDAATAAAADVATGAATGAATDVRVAGALAGDPAATNIFAPCLPANRDLVLRGELRAGRGDRVPVEMLQSAAAQSLARAASSPAAVARAGFGEEKVALMVLGVYRSGTSAIARVLNLCGAALPERVVAPRLSINPRGFWEAEAVSDLDVRFLHYLGADWNSLDVTLPRDGPLVDEFLTQAREVLVHEYRDAKLILVKDPRVCMLAPLWHRALVAGGYRPAYVVALRHPLEVARSFERQGDMAVAAGLDLWFAYMQRVETFVTGIGARVAHLGYAELLDDWRQSLQIIARRLDVQLEAGARAGDIDAFLEPGLRNHRSDDGEADPATASIAGSGPRATAIAALYRRLLERCASDRRDV